MKVIKKYLRILRGDYILEHMGLGLWETLFYWAITIGFIVCIVGFIIEFT